MSNLVKQDINLFNNHIGTLFETQIFDCELGSVRVIIDNGEPLFMAYDLCAILETKNGLDMLSSLFIEKIKTYPIKDKYGNVVEVRFLTEAQVYKLIAKGAVNNARALREWITNDVLPSFKTHKVIENKEHSNMQTFSFGDLQVETIFQNDSPYFRLRDIVNILEISRTTASNWLANNWFDDDEIVDVRNSDIGGHPVKYVAESGLYRILNRTNSPKAKPFERWVTKEVLPSIRKTGGYEVKSQFKAPTNMIEALELALEQAKKIEALEKKAEIDKPKVEFANKVSNADNAISIGGFAKLLADKSIKIGQNRLFEWLRSNKYIDTNNLPYQKYLENGYFKVMEQTYETRNGKDMVSLKTLITGKGQIYFTNKLMLSQPVVGFAYNRNKTK